MHHHSADVQVCFVGDNPQDCSLLLFCDASFAAELRDSKSTSGALLALAGPNTFMPITWFVKKQGATTHSSSESEIVSLDTSLRVAGLPALTFWEAVVDTFHPLGDNPAGGFSRMPTTIGEYIDFVPPTLKRYSGRVKLVILEDNEPVIQMCIKCRAPALRHLARTLRINLD